jgi:hypothetical protein
MLPYWNTLYLCSMRFKVVLCFRNETRWLYLCSMWFKVILCFRNEGCWPVSTYTSIHSVLPTSTEQKRTPAAFGRIHVERIKHLLTVSVWTLPRRWKLRNIILKDNYNRLLWRSLHQIRSCCDDILGFIISDYGTLGSIVGWGTKVETGRPWVRFPMRPWKF